MRRRLSTVAVLAPVFIVALASAPAHAEEETVGILHVEVVGASKTAAEMFESSLEDGLGNAGFKVARREKMRELLEPSGFQAGCMFGPCLKPIHGITGVRLVLVARITSVGKNFTYLVTLLDTREGAVAAQATDDCPVCTVDEAVATAAMAVIGLVTGASDPEMVDPTIPARLDVNAAIEAQRAAEDTLAARKKSLRRGSVFLLSMAAIAGAVSATAFLKDEDEAGYVAAGVGGAFVISGGTLLIISRKF